MICCVANGEVVAHPGTFGFRREVGKGEKNGREGWIAVCVVCSFLRVCMDVVEGREATDRLGVPQLARNGANEASGVSGESGAGGRRNASGGPRTGPSRRAQHSTFSLARSLSLCLSRSLSLALSAHTHNRHTHMQHTRMQHTHMLTITTTTSTQVANSILNDVMNVVYTTYTQPK